MKDAEADLRAAHLNVWELRRQLDTARPWARRALKTQLADAVDLEDQASARLDHANKSATEPRRHVTNAVEARQPIADLVETRQMQQRLEQLRHPPAVTRDHGGLEL